MQLKGHVEIPGIHARTRELSTLWLPNSRDTHVVFTLPSILDVLLYHVAYLLTLCLRTEIVEGLGETRLTELRKLMYEK